MRSSTAATRLATLLAGALLAACAAPRFYQREALVLDDASLARFEVSYSDRSDCLLRQRWPARYGVDRGPYQLALIPVLRFSDEPPELGLEVRGDGAPSAQVSGAESVEDTLAPPGVHRYRLHPPQRAGALGITIWRGDARIGAEELSFHAEQCRALLWRD